MRPREDLDRIHRTALRVFADYGFKKATLDDIAAQLGMTKGNLYRYARNKKDLYRATVAGALEGWQARVRAAIEACDDPRAQFDTMCLTAVSYLADDNDLRRLLVRDPDIFPLFADPDPYAQINRRSLDIIRRILRDGVDAGIFRPVDIDAVSEAIFSIYKMFVIRVYIRTQDPSALEIVTHTVDLMTRGLFVCAASPEASAGRNPTPSKEAPHA